MDPVYPRGSGIAVPVPNNPSDQIRVHIEAICTQFGDPLDQAVRISTFLSDYSGTKAGTIIAKLLQHDRETLKRILLIASVSECDVLVTKLRKAIAQLSDEPDIDALLEELVTPVCLVKVLSLLAPALRGERLATAIGHLHTHRPEELLELADHENNELALCIGELKAGKKIKNKKLAISIYDCVIPSIIPLCDAQTHGEETAKRAIGFFIRAPHLLRHGISIVVSWENEKRSAFVELFSIAKLCVENTHQLCCAANALITMTPTQEMRRLLSKQLLAHKLNKTDQAQKNTLTAIAKGNFGYLAAYLICVLPKGTAEYFLCEKDCISNRTKIYYHAGQLPPQDVRHIANRLKNRNPLFLDPYLKLTYRKNNAGSALYSLKTLGEEISQLESEGIEGVTEEPLQLFEDAPPFALALCACHPKGFKSVIPHLGQFSDKALAYAATAMSKDQLKHKLTIKSFHAMRRDQQRHFLNHLSNESFKTYTRKNVSEFSTLLDALTQVQIKASHPNYTPRVTHIDHFNHTLSRLTYLQLYAEVSKGRTGGNRAIESLRLQIKGLNHTLDWLRTNTTLPEIELGELPQHVWLDLTPGQTKHLNTDLLSRLEDLGLTCNEDLKLLGIDGKAYNALADQKTNLTPEETDNEAIKQIQAGWKQVLNIGLDLEEAKFKEEVDALVLLLKKGTTAEEVQSIAERSLPRVLQRFLMQPGLEERCKAQTEGVILQPLHKLAQQHPDGGFDPFNLFG